MRYRHANKTLRRIDEEPDFTSGFAANLVRAFRMRMQAIRAAANENDLRALKSLRFEKLKGDRKHQYSMRLNDQFRLIFQIEESDQGNIIIVLAIEDYH
ncbi:MAG TPA: type II toxin-antitoxin system RelE/ParE family toxin [Isosphaeraceae bacterium]|nr:type II toxin-antitoxin system RelE/ParE family toxin [Isosphaeraceae bacterium]